MERPRNPRHRHCVLQRRHRGCGRDRVARAGHRAVRQPRLERPRPHRRAARQRERRPAVEGGTTGRVRPVERVTNRRPNGCTGDAHRHGVVVIGAAGTDHRHHHRRNNTTITGRQRHPGVRAVAIEQHIPVPTGRIGHRDRLAVARQVWAEVKNAARRRRPAFHIQVAIPAAPGNADDQRGLARRHRKLVEPLAVLRPRNPRHRHAGLQVCRRGVNRTSGHRDIDGVGLTSARGVLGDDVVAIRLSAGQVRVVLKGPLRDAWPIQDAVAIDIISDARTAGLRPPQVHRRSGRPARVPIWRVVAQGKRAGLRHRRGGHGDIDGVGLTSARGVLGNDVVAIRLSAGQVRVVLEVQYCEVWPIQDAVAIDIIGDARAAGCRPPQVHRRSWRPARIPIRRVVGEREAARWTDRCISPIDRDSP